jgi:hypothetical protein
LRLNIVQFILGGLLALFFLLPACTDNAVANPVQISSSSQDTLIKRNYGYICDRTPLNVPCDGDTSLGFVDENIPIEKGVDPMSISIVQLWKIDQEIFALNVTGNPLWSKTHGQEEWRKIPLPLNDSIAIAKPIFYFKNQRYALMNSGKVYHFDQNGLGTEALQFNLPQGDSACAAYKPCYYNRIEELKGVLYAFAVHPYLENDSGVEWSFLYQSLDAGKTWQRRKDYPSAKMMYDWLTYRDTAYVLFSGELPQRFDGEKFDTLQGNYYIHWGNFVVLQNQLYLGGVDYLYEVQSNTYTAKFYYPYTGAIFDTLCNAIVNVRQDVYWRPGMPITKQSWSGRNLGYQYIQDSTGGRWWKNLSMSDVNSILRVGDTMYSSSMAYNNSRYKGKTDPFTISPGSVASFNLRNSPFCPEAWERGNTIGGRTYP